MSDSSSINRYKLDQILSLQSFKQFIMDYKYDNLLPQVKVETIKSQDHPHLLKLNSQTHNEVINNTSKDVFVFYTQAGCQLCQQFYKGYEKASEHFSKVEDLVFTYIDMSQNELPEKGIKYFPYVVLYTTKNKVFGVEYDLGIDYTDIVKFLEKRATVEIYPEFKKEEEEVKEDDL